MRCESGLIERLGKPWCRKVPRGFKSHPHRLKIITEQITVDELKEMSEKMFGNLIKAVVDVGREIMAVDGELHADLAELLTENGSRHENLWVERLVEK